MSNIVKNYFRVLEVISSLNCKLEYKSEVGRKQKMSDLEVVALSLTAEFMSIDSENSLFKEISKHIKIVDYICFCLISLCLCLKNGIYTSIFVKIIRDLVATIIQSK